MSVKNRIDRGNGIFGNVICGGFLIAFVVFACIYLPQAESERLRAAQIPNPAGPTTPSVRYVSHEAEPAVPQPRLAFNERDTSRASANLKTRQLRPLNLDGLRVAADAPTHRIWAGHRQASRDRQ